MSAHVLRRPLLSASASVAAALLLLAAFSPGYQGPLSPQPAQAAFHLAVIDEVMTSYNGDPTVQFVEIRMLALGQTFVADSVLGAFSDTGSYLGDVLVVPGNIANSGAGLRWLMGTTQFQTVSGITPDFTIPASLPTAGGMVCWGAPGLLPPLPGTWDHSIPALYLDCVAYGTYSGPTNIHIGTPTSLDGVGHSLQRLTDTNSSANDFACGDPANPTTNAPTSTSLAATTACPPAPVGGIADFPDIDEPSFNTSEPSDESSFPLAALAGGLAAAVAALAVAGGWYARRRRLR